MFRTRFSSQIRAARRVLNYVNLPRGSRIMENKDYKTSIYFAENDFFIGVSPSGHAVSMDANSERNAAPTPLELLLIAVGSCTAYDVIDILRKKRQDVTDYRIEVRGARRDDYPRSFKRLEVHHIVRGRAVSSEAVRQAVELSDQKYCSVIATVRPAAEVVSTFEILEQGDEK
ncbi:MAG: OsmC family protein [Acidobacteriota bacterium]|nr:OsmC family protein [Acidobacteriota bacterium]